MKIIVAGSRTFQDYDLLEKKLNRILQKIKKITILSGHAAGADLLGEFWAYKYGHRVEVFKANWDKHGKSAGVIRNRQMIEEGGATALVAFWNGLSPGTKNMIDLATQYGLKVRIIKCTGDFGMRQLFRNTDPYPCMEKNRGGKGKKGTS